MALPTRLGNAGEGWHGDQAVQVKGTLESIVALGTAVQESFNDLLNKLDGDTGVTDTNYLSTLEVDAIVPTLVGREVVGFGGSLLSGDSGVITRQVIIDLVTVVNAFRTNFNDLLDKLDADVLVGDTDYGDLAITSPAAALVNAEAMNGGRSLHTDEGVALRQILEALISVDNEVKDQQNILLAKLDADSGVNQTNYFSTLEVTEADAA